MNKSVHTDSSLESAKSWRHLISTIFHLFGNKLLSISSVNRLLNSTLPDLLKGYNLAIEHKLMEPSIHPKLLESISTQANMDDSINPMLQIMDEVLSMCKSLCNIQNVNNALSVKTLIENICDNFEFKNNTRELIELNTSNDFDISCPVIFLNATLIQLLNFAQNNFKDPKRIISIYLSKKNTNLNSIHFKITSSETESNYDSFLQNTLIECSGKFIPGFEFCRLAIFYAGGNILWEVKERNYIEFIISIPK